MCSSQIPNRRTIVTKINPMSLTGDCQRNLSNELLQQSFCEQSALQTNIMAPKKKMRRSVFNPKQTSLRRQASVSLESVHLEESDLDDTEDECLDQSTDSKDLSEIYRQYRLECEQLVLSSTALDKEQYISALESLVRDLIEQNQCLVDSISEIKHESALRVKEMQRRLQKSASRTEEVMLALASHELYLKQFVDQHCCCCCGCDTRLMQFKLCHRDQCERDHDQFNTFPNQCRSYGHEWHSIVNNTSNWFANKRFSKSDCLHNLSSEIRFTNLVNKIDERIHHLEVENDEIKQENGMIRELNSMLSGRKEAQMTVDNCRNEMTISERLYPITSHSVNLNLSTKARKDIDSVELNEDLITFLGESGQVDMFSSYLTDSLELRDGLDSCGGSRSDSLNGRLDNDSGCSTDLIPSQTDMNSLIMSDCEEDCEDLVRSILSNFQLQTDKDIDSSIQPSSDLNELNCLRAKLTLAERLVPKLYNKLLYYLVQRNMLLRQFQQENRARQKCKLELSTLADCVTLGLKDIEFNTKTIKQIQIASSSSLF